MQILIDVVLPVFLVIGFGYAAVWQGFFKIEQVEGLLGFTQGFALPVLLFVAISGLDLSTGFDFRLLISFYTGATTGFVAGLFGARFLFGRDWEDSVAIGFVCLFSNSLLLGLAITERAYGADALAGNYAIIALHAPFCYGLGITVMEIVRAKGRAGGRLLPTVARAMFRNALVIGIGLGFAVNFSGLAMPETIQAGLDLIARAALPAALFGMGGVLYQYRPEGDWLTIAYVCAVALVLHPVIVWTLATTLAVPQAGFRSGVLTAAMAPGVNAYLFANIYGRARRVAASSVLVGTALSILTVWVWLGQLP